MKRMKPFNKAEAYSWAASRCAQKEYCRMELAQKFMQRGLSLSDCNEVLDQLERERFIDEARYARAFVHDKTLYDRWGRMKTRQALAVKNISNVDIEQALATIDPAEYREILRRLLLTKAPTIKADTDYERAQKLLRFAAGRGFEAELVFSVIGEE